MRPRPGGLFGAYVLVGTIWAVIVNVDAQAHAGGSVMAALAWDGPFVDKWLAVAHWTLVPMAVWPLHLVLAVAAIAGGAAQLPRLP